MIELVTATQRAHPDQVVVLAGNHDRWFLDSLDGDDNELTWLMSDLDLTVKSLLEPLVLAQALGHEDPTSDTSAPPRFTEILA